jgi:hypothetical protein
MIILDAPYVSDFLIDTIKKNEFSVLKNSFSLLQTDLSPLLVEEQDFIDLVRKQAHPKIYSNTENAIGWITKQLSFMNLPNSIEIFKNKVKFREIIQHIYPEFFYKSIAIQELKELDISTYPFPFIVKPSVGFFSMSVYRVDDPSQWNGIVASIHQELEDSVGIYPKEVFDAQMFIIEEYIEGEEFAFDAYFDENGEAILLNTYQHYFAHEHDVSDRVYFTSKAILMRYRDGFTHFLTELGKTTKLKNFPIHVEVRISANGKLVPIEANPFRFGGWCTTADITKYAFGFNPYEYYLLSKKPDWNSILQKMNDSFYSIVVLNNSTGVTGKNIQSFDYEKLKTHFTKVLELRKVDYKRYPLFGFIFAETPQNNFDELIQIAESNLKEFI